MEPGRSGQRAGLFTLKVSDLLLGPLRCLATNHPLLNFLSPALCLEQPRFMCSVNKTGSVGRGSAVILEKAWTCRTCHAAMLVRGGAAAKAEKSPQERRCPCTTAVPRPGLGGLVRNPALPSPLFILLYLNPALCLSAAALSSLSAHRGSSRSHWLLLVSIKSC